MPSRKAQLVSPLSGEYLSVPGISVTGVITATGGITGVVGVAQSIADGADLDLGTVTGTTFVGDSIGTYRATGLTNTGAGTSNLNVGVVTATSISGVVTGNITGTASSIISGSDLTVGVATAVTWLGDGSGITGAGSSAFIGQAVTAQAGTTTIDLSAGNLINFTHSNNTTVAFANTTTANRVTFIRTTTANTITWPTSITWSGLGDDGASPVLISNSRTTAFQVFNLTTADGGVTWYGWQSVEDDPQTFTRWGWGKNWNGQLGQNSATYYSSPIQLPGTTWLMTNNGLTYTQGLTSIETKSDGTLWSWGYGYQGSLGQNDTTIIRYSSPTQVGTDTNWAVGASNRAVLWSKTDGTLWAWGTNTGGQLGLNESGPGPSKKSSPTQVGTDTNWSTSHSTGGKYAGDHNAPAGRSGAIKNDGSLWVWGNNDLGGLGQNSTTKYSSPVQVPGTWKSISFCNSGSLALKGDGTAWVWGYNSNGILGLNAQGIGPSSPIQIPGSWASFTAGRQNASGVKTDGTLWSWGYNNYGQLGHGDTTQYSSPVQVGANDTWSTNAFAAGGMGYLYNTTYLKNDGTLWSWGRNDNYGQLGLNDKTNYSSPKQITGTNWGGVTLSSDTVVAHQFT